MQRAYTYNALTLRVKPSGESNRDAWFLTAEEGILRATVFGGPKSRLRARVAPYHEGTLWLYHDPVRNTYKVSDFDVLSYRTGIRELYERAMTAGVVAETILATSGGGGGWSSAAELAGNVLDAIDSSDAALSRRLGLYFLWHWTWVLGVRPDLSVCALCGKELRQDEALWYVNRREALFCESCAGRMLSQPEAGVSIRLGPGAIRWLKAIEPLRAAETTRISLDDPSLEQVSLISKTVLAAALGQKLPTWEGI